MDFGTPEAPRALVVPAVAPTFPPNAFGAYAPLSWFYTLQVLLQTPVGCTNVFWELPVVVTFTPTAQVLAQPQYARPASNVLVRGRSAVRSRRRRTSSADDPRLGCAAAASRLRRRRDLPADGPRLGRAAVATLSRRRYAPLPYVVAPPGAEAVASVLPVGVVFDLPLPSGDVVAVCGPQDIRDRQCETKLWKQFGLGSVRRLTGLRRSPAPSWKY